MNENLLELYLSVFYTMAYPPFIVLLIIYLNIGIWGWAVFALFLTPPTVAWYIIMKRRVINFLKLLMETKPKRWDIKTAVEEYIALLNQEKKEN